jgi:RNA polymerase sigma-70 factor (ECF subfamily)
MGSTETEVVQEVEWIRRVQRGDREAFGPLLERYQRRVLTLIYHLVRRGDEAEDLAQEVFIKAFRAIRSYTFKASFKSWLSRITVNHCYDYLRRERASRVSYYWQFSEESQRDIEARLESPEVGGLDTAQYAALKDLVGKLLERAPADDQVILGLKELSQLSVEEIAEIMDLNPSTVKVRLHRARHRMLADFKQWRQRR